MLVFVKNKHGENLMPCKPSKARKLLKQKKAKIIFPQLMPQVLPSLGHQNNVGDDVIKYILLIFVFIYLIINKIIKLKKIEYQKNNLILKEILEIAYKSQIVEDAGVKIISILNKL